ncbi:MAG: hypothetical protein WA991_07305 [Ornithinimicrobium sp.]
MSTQEKERLEINWFNSAGAALGAVSAAVVLSSLGAAGTLVGAAMGSLCITIGGAVYAHSMRVTKERVAAAKALASKRKARAQDTVLIGASTPHTSAEPDPIDPADALEPTKASGDDESWVDVSRGLPWKRIAAVSAALFGVTMAIILAFELTTGRAVSTYTGGTSDTEVGTTFSGLGAEVTDSSSGSDADDPWQQNEDQPQQEDPADVPAPEDSDEQAPDQEDPAPAESESEEEAPAPAEQPEPAPAPAPAPAEQAPGE